MTEGASRVPGPEGRVVAVIPARWGSTRFPGKPVAPLAGRPLIAHVIEAALAATRVHGVLVATDDARIEAAAREAGASVALTRADHATGSDRIGEAIAGVEADVVLNVQGDEPLVPSSAIDRLVELLQSHPEAGASTLASPFEGEDHADPNVVKVVRALDGRALYFSRGAIPGRHPSAAPGAGLVRAWRHVGLYGFRRPVLERFLGWKPTPLELQEGLEQLRLLEHGEVVVVGEVPALPPGVDTPRDLERCERLLAHPHGPG